VPISRASICRPELIVTDRFCAGHDTSSHHQ